jgi:SNF2 family DNA or RNA helicase
MGLGKTVQMIARICERKANPAEQKAGYAGTLYVHPARLP